VRILVARGGLRRLNLHYLSHRLVHLSIYPCVVDGPAAKQWPHSTATARAKTTADPLTCSTSRAATGMGDAEKICGC